MSLQVAASVHVSGMMVTPNVTLDLGLIVVVDGETDVNAFIDKDCTCPGKPKESKDEVVVVRRSVVKAGT